MQLQKRDKKIKHKNWKTNNKKRGEKKANDECLKIFKIRFGWNEKELKGKK